MRPGGLAPTAGWLQAGPWFRRSFRERVGFCPNADTLTFVLPVLPFAPRRTDDVKENVLAVSLFVLVSLLGFLTLTRGFSRDLWLLLFCHVMASCQYSLLKARPRPGPAPAPQPPGSTGR